MIQYGYAGSFNGSSSIVVISDSSSISDTFISSKWTVVMWVKVSGKNTAGNALMLFNTVPTRFWIEPNTFEIQGQIKYSDNTSDNPTSGLYALSSKWNFIVISKNRDSVDITLNTNKTTISVQNKDGVDPSVFRVGAGSSTTEFLNGFILETILYDKKLTDSEISHIYHNPYDPVDYDSIVLWLIGNTIDTSAGTWYDLSQYKNNGTLTDVTKTDISRETLVEVLG
jgi:hypothetical protein